MFVVKRIFLDNKRLACCISTSAIRNCDQSKKTSELLRSFLEEKDKDERVKRGKRLESLKYPSKVVSLEEKKKAKDGLSDLLKGISVETAGAEKEKEESMYLSDMLVKQKERTQRRINSKKDVVSLLFEAAENVAESVGGDAEETKTDLFSQLEKMQVTKETVETFEMGKPEIGPSSADTLETFKHLFESEGLGIFVNPNQSAPQVKLKIWDKLEEEELAYKASHPPRNQFEEWILWTEQGKLWHFPIDNDQGMEEEGKTDFMEHVFLEEHLEPWCPKKGPLKKFMDLVLVGLSKNPYLTVEAKKEHIFWYRDYFENKKKLLQELGALGSGKEIQQSKDTKEAM